MKQAVKPHKRGVVMGTGAAVWSARQATRHAVRPRQTKNVTAARLSCSTTHTHEHCQLYLGYTSEHYKHWELTLLHWKLIYLGYQREGMTFLVGGGVPPLTLSDYAPSRVY